MFSIQHSVETERKRFLKKLLLNPYFCFRHFPQLSAFAWQRVQARFKNRKALPHQANKMVPACVRAQVAEIQLPIFKTAKKTTRTITDPERYWQTVRFAELLPLLLKKKSLKLPRTISQFISLPPPLDDAAWETYSTSERVCQLSYWFLHGNPHTTIRLKKFLQFSIDWIATHLEYYGSRTSNHILNNARALILGGVILNSPLHIEIGMTLLQAQLPFFINEHGSLRESSSHYQLLILTWLLDCQHFLAFTNHKLPALDVYLRRMLQVAANLTDEHGSLIGLIGDISPDLTPKLTVERLKHFYPSVYPPRLQAVNVAPWIRIKNTKQQILLHCPSDQYPPPHASHAHNDFTSFCWQWREKPILIDVGRSSYAKNSVANWQKSACGHSVPFVNGFPPLAESMVIAGHWWPMPYAKAALNVTNTRDTITLEHDGFKRATPVQMHQRQLILQHNSLILKDHFQGRGHITLQLFFQLAPGFVQSAQNPFLFEASNCELKIECLAPATKPKLEVISSHHATAYGEEIPHNTIILEWRLPLPIYTDLHFKVSTCVV